MTPLGMVKYDEEERDLWTLQRQRKGHEVRRTNDPIKAVQTFLFDRIMSLGSMTLVRFDPIIDILLESGKMHRCKVELRVGHVPVGTL